MSMIVTMLAASMAMQPADTVAEPRTKFEECLEQRIAAAKQAGETPDNFRRAIRTACAAEAQAFKMALLAYDRSIGQDPREAESWADQDVNDHRDAAARRFERQ